MELDSAQAHEHSCFFIAAVPAMQDMRWHDVIVVRLVQACNAHRYGHSLVRQQKLCSGLAAHDATVQC